MPADAQAQQLGAVFGNVTNRDTKDGDIMFPLIVNRFVEVLLPSGPDSSSSPGC